jgi:hypothetical protein
MGEKIYEKLWYKNVKEGEHLRYPDVYWRIILKQILMHIGIKTSGRLSSLP